MSLKKGEAIITNGPRIGVHSLGLLANEAMKLSSELRYAAAAPPLLSDSLAAYCGR